MNHPPAVDADYFHTFNSQAELHGYASVEYIFRKVGDGPLTMWYLGSHGEAVEVNDRSDMPFDDLVWERMPDVETSARVTGSVGSKHVVTFGASPVVIEWFRDQPAPAPDPKPSNPFAERTIDTQYLLAPPSHFNGMRVIAHAFIPGDFGALDAHLVIYYTGTDAFWAPSVIDYATAVFGLGRVEYDDDAQKDMHVELLTEAPYSSALAAYATALADALGANLA
jgi:hypothetical protein